jgi:hypothetical protein
MKRIFLFLILVMMPVALAAEMPPLGQFKDNYNDNIDKVPGFVKRILGSERINALVLLENGDQLNISLVTKKAAIESLDYGMLENPTLIIRTTEKTIMDIIAADNPGKRFKEALNNKEITYEAQTFFKKIKWGFNSLFLRLALWFGSK